MVLFGQDTGIQEENLDEFTHTHKHTHKAIEIMNEFGNIAKYMVNIKKE